VGYLSSRYASSHAEFGTPVTLPRSRGWLLVRPVPGSGMRDAIAGFRRLVCADWSGLAADLREANDLVSITAVTDAFAPVTPAGLRGAFPDLVRQYKHHFVVDLASPSPSRHHRAKARRALRSLDVRLEREPIAYLDEWSALYGELCRRRGLAGVEALSRAAFREQLAVPGCVSSRALRGGKCVSTILLYMMGSIVYYHLGASDAEGYAQSASYALFTSAIEFFAGAGLHWLDLGANAGADPDTRDGLTRFKQGWATATRPTYLCGRVNDPLEYARLVALLPHGDADYFPAYRGRRG
jgi:hypothetical protein